MQNRFFPVLLFDFPFWRNPNFGNFYWFSIGFLLENQVKITKIWNFQKFPHRKIENTKTLRDPIEKMLFPLQASHVGAGLTAFRIVPKHLVKERSVRPQLIDVPYSVEILTTLPISQYLVNISTFAPNVRSALRLD